MKTKYIILSAPSGSGKSTIASFLLNEIESLSFSVSSTNRKKRKNENEGIDYYFISREKFKFHIESGYFIEWEEVYTNHYKGTLKSEIDRLIKEKRNIKISTLDSILLNEKISRPILIKMDVQGYELEVLKGSNDLLKKTDYLLLEVSENEMYQNQPTEKIIIKYLKDLNFNIFKANEWLNIKNTNFNQRDVLFYKKQ